MKPSSMRVATRYSEARTRTPLEGFLDYFRTREEVYKETYENELKLTKEFFFITHQISLGEAVKELLELYKSYQETGNWAESPKDLVLKLTKQVTLTATKYLNKFDSDVLAKIKGRRSFLGDLPTQILEFQETILDLSKRASSGIGVPLFLKTLGVPMEAFRTASFGRSEFWEDLSKREDWREVPPDFRERAEKKIVLKLKKQIAQKGYKADAKIDLYANSLTVFLPGTFLEDFEPGLSLLDREEIVDRIDGDLEGEFDNNVAKVLAPYVDIDRDQNGWAALPNQGGINVNFHLSMR